MARKFWNDERGGVITTELVLVASSTVAILLSGLNMIREGVHSEFEHVRESISVHRTQNDSTYQSNVESDQPEFQSTYHPAPAAYVEIFQQEFSDE